MRRSLKTALTSLLGVAIVTSVTSSPATAAGLFRVSQESAAGLGDFDDNILGFVNSFETTGTIANFYQYSNGFGASFNGPVSLTSNASHLFLVQASDGLGLFSVHDKPRDVGGERANMQLDLVGDTAAFLVRDEDRAYTNGSTFTTQNGWYDCCTDGFAIGSLDNDWTMFAQFTQLGAYDGGQLTSWQALSNDDSSVSLALETGRQVRIDRVTDVPEPTSIFGLLAVILGGSAIKRRDIVS